MIFLKYIMIILSFFGLDVLSKSIIDKNLILGKEINIKLSDDTKSKVFIKHIKNYGFVYHRFSGKTNLLRWVSGLTLSGYSLLFLYDLIKGKTKYLLPMSIFLGGGFGNFYERLKKGYITDFILIKKGKNPPVFNIADMLLVIGSIWYAIMHIFDKSEE